MNVVHLIDCMEFMKTVPDKYYELAIVDPPYGIGNWIDNNNFYKTGNRKGQRRKSTRLGAKKIKWNNNIPPDDYFKELIRISNKQIIWGANYYNCFIKGGAIIWDKGESNPVFSQCEIASLSFQQKVDYIRINWQSGFFRQQKETIIHECQKPVALYKWLLQNYAKPGDKIFDSHVGSGSSRIACHDLGFDFEGCELDPDYWQGQEERYKAHISQQSLFDTSEIQELIYHD